jgi:hypothetical protein
MKKPNPKTLSRQNKLRALRNIIGLALDLALLDHKDRDRIDGRKFKAAEKELIEIKKSIVLPVQVRKEDN